MRVWRCWSVLLPLMSLAPACRAEAPSVDAVLAGLAPTASLGQTELGRAALAANARVTASVQTGTAAQPLLLPFAAQEAQALRDATITGADLADLADGLGTRLDRAWRAGADDAAPNTVTKLPPAPATLVSYTLDLVLSDASVAKFFFANGTIDGRVAAAPRLAALLATTDVFGRAYGLPAGAPGADRFGDSRPFQTMHGLRRFGGRDDFGAPAASTDFLTGPVQDLRNSPSFPSGHTAYGTAGALLLGFLVPARFPEEVARGAEYGNDRIVLGAHYAMDVVAGRTLALYDMARLLANDGHAVGQKMRHGAAIADFPASLAAARRDIVPVLARACGIDVVHCASDDTGRFADLARDGTMVRATLDEGLPVVHPAQRGRKEDVATVAPEAGRLLTEAYPSLSLAEADTILTETEGPGGGFLDDGSRFGLYSRLDLFAAASVALARRAATDAGSSPR